MKVVSLFSGIGAYEKALVNLGIKHEVAHYCEIDNIKSKAYSVLHGVSEDRNLRDVTQLADKEIEDFDLLVYSPPCQSYSTAGKRKGLEDVRGTLFYNALEVIQRKKPKYAIMENVANLSKSFKDEFSDMLKALEQEGYNNYWKNINARDFIPQNRDRVYIVSIRKDLDDGSFEFLEGTNNENWYDYIDVEDTRSITPRQQRMIDVATGVNKKDKIKVEGKVNFHNSVIWLRQSGLRFQTNREYPTITAAYGKGGGNFTMITKDGKIGGITPRNCFKLMGFDYEDADRLLERKFSNSALYRMAGDSVCVPVLESIFKILLDKELHRND